MSSGTDNESTEMRIAFSPLVEVLPEWGRTVDPCDRDTESQRNPVDQLRVPQAGDMDRRCDRAIPVRDAEHAPPRFGPVAVARSN